MINCICIYCEVVFVLKKKMLQGADQTDTFLRMLGSIVRQAVEGGGELLKTWMNRKTGSN